MTFRHSRVCVCLYNLYNLYRILYPAQQGGARHAGDGSEVTHGTYDLAAGSEISESEVGVSVP